MILDIALDADAEWDSSTDWAQLGRGRRRSRDRRKRASRSSPTARAPVELSVRLTERRGSPCAERRMARQGQADQRPVLPAGRAKRAGRRGADGPELMLGDIILARGVCAREAAEKAIPSTSMPRI